MTNTNTELVTFTVKGFRDVYWCYILNEPMINQFKREPGQEPKLMCPNCNWVDYGKEPSEEFLSQHVFICHIVKP